MLIPRLRAQGEGLCLSTTPACSLFHLQTFALAHSPLCRLLETREGILTFHQRCQGEAQTPKTPSLLHLQLLIHSTAHSAVPLSEQMTGLIPQVFVMVFDNGLNTKRAAGIIWKKRKQLPGLNGSTVMLVLCRLQQRKPPCTYIQLAQPFNNPIKQKWKGNWSQRGPRGKGNSVCPFRLCS